MHVLEAALFANFVRSPMEALSDRPRDYGCWARHDLLAGPVRRGGLPLVRRFRRLLAGEGRNPQVASNVG
jgi:hypothetical protein